jgi:protein-disulfide isomerase
MDNDPAFTRRSVLTGAGALAASALGGCLAGDQPGGSDGTDVGGTPINDHPAAAGLADQPQKGPDPFEADGVIIAFEDPSCTRCRAFEQNTVPQIESELVASATATFVFRGYPVIYPWGEPATHALEATFARDPDAFWALKDYYYATQREFSTDNVLDRTRDFLANETAVDPAAVIEAVESGETDEHGQHRYRPQEPPTHSGQDHATGDRNLERVHQFLLYRGRRGFGCLAAHRSRAHIHHY